MALITCPECGRQVSDAAISCPNCGFPIQKANNTKIRIKIDQDPVVPGSFIKIYSTTTGELLAKGQAGTTIEFESKEEIAINICGLTKIPMIVTKVSPQNGGRYRASWGAGFFSPKIVSCSPVDIIDS